MLSFNSQPYFNDYDPKSEYYDVLARPGFALQARELNVAASIHEEQIRRFGKSIFKDGAMVIPGQITFDPNIAVVNILSTFNSQSVIWNLIDPSSIDNTNNIVKVHGLTSGVSAQILKIDTLLSKIYVKYVSSGTDKVTSTFLDNETLALTSNNVSVVQTTLTQSTGITSGASIASGVYFIFGRMLSVNSQTIILGDNPTTRVGLNVQEAIVTPEDDVTLTDNALGSPNLSAPGAHRYKISLILSAFSVDDLNSENFVELLRLENGQIQNIVNNTQYSEIEKTLARRTEETNGSFTVNPFKVTLREHLLQNNNGGLLPSSSGGNETKLVADFSPSTAFVEGHEIQTISTSHVEINKSRTIASSTNSRTRAYLGNYILIDRLFGFPNYDTLPTVNLYSYPVVTDGVAPADPFPIGTAVIKGIEYYSGNFDTVGNNGPIWKAYISEITMVAGSGIQNVRAIASNDGAFLFTCNVLHQVSVVNRVGVFTPAALITDSTSSFVEKVIAFDAVNNNLFTQPSNSINMPNNSFVTGSAGGTGTVNGRTVLFDTVDSCVVYPLPQNTISTTRDILGNVTMNYPFRKIFSPQTVSTVGQNSTVTFTAASNEIFGPVTTQDYFATIESGSNKGTILNVSTLSPSLFSGLTQLTFNAPAGTTIKLSATMVKTASQERSKTLTTGSVTITTAGTVPSIINLGKCDCWQPIAIYDGVDNTGLLINDRFIFDDGQRDTHYDFGSLILKPGAITPSRLFCTFYYFVHGGGDYFSVDSYKNFGNFSDWFQKVPSYTLPDGLVVSLRDCIDFRNKRDETNLSTLIFPTSGIGHLVKPNDDFITSFSYYLKRVDKIYLDTQGAFQVLEGTPSLNPTTPSDPKSGGMVLATLRLGAYTFGSKDVTLKLTDNRRYTMRDIGAVVSRVSNLEYYTALSLLEQQAATFSVLDSATGLDRFKNGFVVDSFADYVVSDIGNPDSQFSLDTANRTMRPLYKSDAVDMSLDSSSTGYEFQTQKPTNKLITLPYLEVEVIAQRKASRAENLNPYNVFNYTGSNILNPATDTWKNTDQRPDINVEDNSQYDSVLAATNASRAIGTIWNEWTTSWVGQSQEILAASNITSAEHSVPQRGNVATQDGQWAGFEGVYRQTITPITVVRDSTTIGQSRTGITTSITPKVTQNIIDNKVVNVGLDSYMRARTISFSAKRLKPNTQHWAFFDDIDVNAFVGTATNTLGQPLYTDLNGVLNGVFNLPSTSTNKFAVGSRIFRLCNNSQNSVALIDSFCDATYQASGLVETDQKTITSLQTASVELKNVTQNRIVSNSNVNTLQGNVTWIDPLAQSILVDKLVGGFFATSVELYFRTADPNVPVTLQIRTMQNGTPTQTIVPFSEVTLNGSQVRTNEIPVFDDNNSKTKFSFRSPVYLKQGQEYAIVLISNSNAYNVWCAQLGDLQLFSDFYISQVPYTGVLFKSQNSSTWTPSQTEALMMKVNRAQFDTTVTGSLLFTSNQLPSIDLLSLSLLTSNGSNFIRIKQENHGLFPGALVTVTMPQSSFTLTFNGIPVSKIVPTINSDIHSAAGEILGVRNYIVSNVELDSYTIAIYSDPGTYVVPTNATSSGYCGTSITVNKDIKYDMLMPIVSELNFSGTDTSWGIKSVSGQSTHGIQIPYVKDTIFTSFIPNHNLFFATPRVVASQINENNLINLGSNFKNKSIVFNVSLSSTSDNLSPVIDTERISSILISNRIDNRTDVSTPTTTPSAAQPYYVPETTNFGATAPARYILRPAKLQNSSKSIHFVMNVNWPSDTSVDLYYKVLPEDSIAKFENQPYVLMSRDATTDFSPAQNANDFRDYYWTVDNISKFTIFSIKIVMRSSNSCHVPQCKDLRAIALED